MRTVLFCPFTAGTLLWQAQSGAWTLSVCVRGTFSMVHGREVVLADVQEPVGPARHVGDASSSLISSSDILPYKPRIDVVLVGSAFAPDQPVDALVARLSLGAIDKSIGIIGDRRWIEGPEGPEPSAPTPFRSMPLTYERAARSRDNPHGFDLTATPAVGAIALPNLEAVDDGVLAVGAVGFGPVAPASSARRGLLRADGWAWVEGGGRGPAPAGFDYGFYNAAPRDQQLDTLRLGESLVLTNLSRAHPRLETRLPTVRPRAFLVPAELERGFEVNLRCDTVWIDTDRGLVTVSWRGVATVDTPDEESLGTVVVAVDAKGREVGYAQIARLVREGPTSADSDTFTESRTLLRPDSVSDFDSDVLPTPGAFKARRPLPVVGAARAEASIDKLAPPRRAEVAIADDEPGPVSTDDLSKTHALDPPTVETTVGRRGVSRQVGAPNVEDAKTMTRIDARSLADEPSTKPMLVTPAPRRALEVADYARIAVAVERGDSARTLFHYGLALPDLPRLQREWTERNAADAGFARAFALAVSAARRG